MMREIRGEELEERKRIYFIRNIYNIDRNKLSYVNNGQTCHIPHCTLLWQTLCNYVYPRKYFKFKRLLKVSRGSKTPIKG